MKRKKKIEKKTKPKLLAKLREKFNYVWDMAESLDARDTCVCPAYYWCSEVYVSQVLNNCQRFLNRNLHRQSKKWIDRLLHWLNECELCIMGYGEEYPSKREKEALEELVEEALKDEEMQDIIRTLEQSQDRTVMDLLKWKNIILGLE